MAGTFFRRIDLEPSEMVLSMISVTMLVKKPASGAAEGPESTTEYKPFLIIGTAYALHDEDEPTKGRVMVYSCAPDEEGGDSTGRSVKSVAELQVRGGVYSMCQFYDGNILITVNSKTQLCQLVDEGTGDLKLATTGVGHHGHILSLLVSSRASKTHTPHSVAGEGPTESGEGKEKDESGEGQGAGAAHDF